MRGCTATRVTDLRPTLSLNDSQEGWGTYGEERIGRPTSSRAV